MQLCAKIITTYRVHCRPSTISPSAHHPSATSPSTVSYKRHRTVMVASQLEFTALLLFFVICSSVLYDIKLRSDSQTIPECTKTGDTWTDLQQVSDLPSTVSTYVYRYYPVHPQKLISVARSAKYRTSSRPRTGPTSSVGKEGGREANHYQPAASTPTIAPSHPPTMLLVMMCLLMLLLFDVTVAVAAVTLLAIIVGFVVYRLKEFEVCSDILLKLNFSIPVLIYRMSHFFPAWLEI